MSLLHHVDTTTNKKITLILNNWFPNVTLLEPILQNDSFTKFKAVLGETPCEIIECDNVQKIKTFCKRSVLETFEEYQQFINNYDFSKDRWIFNILDGLSEQEKVLYQDEQILIIPNYTWDGKDSSLLNILTIVKNRTLHSLRDLTIEHVGLLNHIYQQTGKIINEKYGFEPEQLKCFVHYSPTCYQLHVHFTLSTNTNVHSSVEYSHHLLDVIKNLVLCDTYYQMPLRKRI